MRTAVVEIESGRVVTVIERGVQPPNPRIVEATEPPEGFLWVAHETAGIGWMLVDGSLQAPAAEPLTALQIRDRLEAVLDAHVDATARSMGYRSSESCAGYAASTDATFKAEALAFIAWRDALWRAAIAVMQAVLSGQKAVPTDAELLAEMPVFERPGQ